MDKSDVISLKLLRDKGMEGLLETGRLNVNFLNCDFLYFMV